MDYNQLVAPKSTLGSIADMINYAIVPAAEIVQFAQDDIFVQLRVREMRKSVALTLAIGASTAPLPNDYLDTDTLVDQWQSPVVRVTDDEIVQRRALDSTGVLIQSYPRMHGCWDNLFQFDCAASAVVNISGIYYAAPYLSADQPTSFLTQRYSSLLKAAVLKHAYIYRKEMDQAKLQAQLMQDALERIAVADDLSLRGFVPMGRAYG